MACLDLFDARAAEAVTLGETPRHWPPVIHANTLWREQYPPLAAPVGLTLTLDEAITRVQAWIAEIDAASVFLPTWPDGRLEFPIPG
jgi:hypothetical protein